MAQRPSDLWPLPSALCPAVACAADRKQKGHKSLTFEELEERRFRVSLLKLLLAVRRRLHVLVLVLHKYGSRTSCYFPAGLKALSLQLKVYMNSSKGHFRYICMLQNVVCVVNSAYPEIHHSHFGKSRYSWNRYLVNGLLTYYNMLIFRMLVLLILPL